MHCVARGGGDQLLIMRASVCAHSILLWCVCVCVCVWCVVCRFQMFPRRPGRSCFPWRMRKKKRAGNCEGGLLGADGGVWGTGRLH